MKTWVVILAVMVLFCLPVYTHAEEAVDNNDYSNEVVPGKEKTSRWTYTDSIHVGMSIDTEGYADVYCAVTGYQGVVDRIITYVYLQQRVGDHWENVNVTAEVTYDWLVTITDYYTELPVDWGYDYRTHCRVYVYSGNEYEFIEVDSPIHHYHSTDGIPDCSDNDK